MTISSPRVAACWRLALVALAGWGCRPTPSADLVLYNGRLYTLNWTDPLPNGSPAPMAPWDSGTGWRHDASAVAVRAGRIVYVGSDSVARALASNSATQLDLKGGVLLPGLVDAHTHVAELGQSLDRVNLTDAATESEAVERIAARAAQTPPGEWILGWGWDEGAWANRYPDKTLLSLRVPGHPVVLRGLHGFAAWANDRALAEARITAATPVPVGGEIRRGADGVPNGLFLNRAVALLDAAVPAPSPVQRDSQVVRALRTMAQGGYVAVHEAGVSRDVLASFMRLDAAHALPIRVYAMLDGRDASLVREWVARGPMSAADSKSGLLAVRAVKGYYDGALGSRGARLLADYADKAGHRGVSGDNYGFDHVTAAAAMAAGFQLGIHAIGDAGNRATLDFIDSVERAVPAARRGRHRIEHAQVIAPEDMRRFAELGVIASMQPPHAVEDMPWAEERLGPERIRGAYAWRTLRAAGARLVFSSDLPGSDWGIFYGLHSAISRQDKRGTPPDGWRPGERMSVEEAIRGYTSWAAYASFDDDSGGVIVSGRRADFSVLTVDPFRLSPDSLLALGRTRLTVVAGRVVYSDDVR